MVNFNELYNKAVLSARRLKNRLKYLLDFSRAWYWEGESCDMCGRCYRFFYLVTDELWLAVNGTESGALCLECLIEKANRAGVSVRVQDFHYITMLGTAGWECEDLHGATF